MAFKLLGSYLDRPYTFFLNRNSTELSKNVLSEINQVTTGVILPLLQAVARLLVLIALFSLLLFVNYVVAIATVLLFGGSYLLIFLLIRGRMTVAGKLRFEANKKKYSTVANAFGGIKEIKLLNNADFFLRDTVESLDIYAKNQVTHQIYSLVPRYLLEAIAFGSIVLYMLYVNNGSTDLSASIPSLSLFAIVGFKILPALQNIYGAFTKVKFFSKTALHLCEDYVVSAKKKQVEAGAELILKKDIEVKNLSFKYPGTEKIIFNDLTFVIKANTTVGFVGTTGAGKTTLVDILMGLLVSDAGQIMVDGQQITEENIDSWKARIGYVPQRIYLSDESITRNIAFGIPDTLIDQARIERAAAKAQIHDFIISELPHGYQTKVGERGIRLSGGQAQRIGIARALYRNPAVLVLDEATSALDNMTEAEIMKTIKSLNGKCTVLMIAHRLSTIEDCDKIIFLENGKFSAEGNFQELLKHEAFKNLARK
jgi:ABC-type multidrug transport system fused ATPase/permease subunit